MGKAVNVNATEPDRVVIPKDRPLIKATIVVVRDIPRSFDNGLRMEDLGKPDHNTILKQQLQFTNALEGLGVRTVRLPTDENNPDSHFPRDTVLSYKGMLLSLNPGADGRRKEVEKNISDLKDAGLDVKRLHYGQGAYVEGGDVLVFESASLVLIGISGRKENIRTNRKGVDALAKALRDIDPEVTVVAVPHRGTAKHPNGVLHLETGFTPLTSDVALRDPRCHVEWENAYYPLPNSRNVDIPLWRIEELPESEGYAAHVLPLNGAVIIAKGYPTVKRLAEEHYGTVIEVDMSEAKKMDGSLRCWTILHNETK